MVQPMDEPTNLVEFPPFSLVSGGALFRLFRGAHLCGDGLELLSRRIVMLSCITWVPLLILSAFEGNALTGAIRVPFLYDIDAYIRFLIALPILIGAELMVHQNMGPTLQRFLTRKIILRRDLPAFQSAIDAAVRARNSVALEICVIIFVYTAGHWIWQSKVALEEATWYGTPQGAHFHLTIAGYWYAFVCIPIMQFILLRWYLRLFIWFQLLWRISRLNLQLDAAHPDRAGGLNFLGKASYSFAPILIAEGALLAGLFADRVILEGHPFLDFKVSAAILTVVCVLALLGPLFMFTPHLWRTQRAGQREYGLLASQYLAEFREKWIVGVNPKGEQLLGSADIQSLADMENSYDAVRRMRLVPFGLTEVTVLAALTLAPLLPLTLTVWSLDEMVGRVLKMMF
jgi:hypothetical protein